MDLDRKSFLLALGGALLIPAESAYARTKPVSMLPTSKFKRFAWTIDDGVSNTAVSNYLHIAEKYDQHLTFFVTSCYPSWRKNSKRIQELLDQKKIQLANHTLSHRDLSISSDAVIRNQLQVCHSFLLDEFGYDARPYFRPTYGRWNQRVLDVAAELGYTMPMMWYGTLGDGPHLSEKKTLELAIKWLENRRIIVDHANTAKSSNELLRIIEIINKRGLKSVTLREAFGR